MKTAGDLVDLLEEPNTNKIEMQLNSETRQDIYADKKIPIFSEDDEAKLMIQIIFDELALRDSNFASILTFIHFVEMKAGCDNLKSLFRDEIFSASAFKAICILDGDSQTSDSDLDYNICSLPSEKREKDETPMSPEKLVFYHLNNLIADSNNRAFWKNDTIIEQGFSYDWVKDNILPQSEILVDNYKRKESKTLFNQSKYKTFFKLVLKDWVIKSMDGEDMRNFILNLNTLFHKIAPYYGIPRSRWPKISQSQES